MEWNEFIEMKNKMDEKVKEVLKSNYEIDVDEHDVVEIEYFETEVYVSFISWEDNEIISNFSVSMPASLID